MGVSKDLDPGRVAAEVDQFVEGPIALCLINRQRRREAIGAHPFQRLARSFRNRRLTIRAAQPGDL